MDASFYISIASVVFAAISICISIYTNYVNIKDRRLKDHPFFILIQKTYKSEYYFRDYVDPYTYNFIYAHESSEQLRNLKEESVKKYTDELNLNRNGVYIELENCGGIGKNISVTTEVFKPKSLIADEDEHSALHGHGWAHVTKKDPEDGYFTRSLVMNEKEKNSSITPFYDESCYRTQQKGISSNGTLKIRVPKEFIFFSNLRLLDLIDEKPTLKVTVEGLNITDKKFRDVLEISMDTSKDKLDRYKRYLSVSFLSQSISD